MFTGNIIAGHSVSSIKFQGVTTLNQIQQYGLKRPSAVEYAKSGESQEILDAKEMHNEMNRRFDAARVHRAVLYRDYIYGVEVQNLMGGTPAITIWYKSGLEQCDGGVVVPYNSILTAVDGETQTEARYMLRDGIKAGKIGRVKVGRSESRDSFPETGETPVALTVYHGIPKPHAQQILRDYNAEAHPIDPKKAATYDHVGPLSKAVNDVIASCGIPGDGVNRTGLVPGRRYRIAYQQVLMAIAGYVLNGQKPIPVTATNLRQMNRPSANAVPADAVLAIKSLIVGGQLTGAQPIVWQAAGYASSHGNHMLNLPAAVQAYEDTKAGGRGGARMAPRDRIEAIVAAL